MVKKKIDSRIRTIIENGVAERHRSMFIIVGDHGRDQVVNLHYILSKARVRARPNVLWCYKKELGFTSNRLKRANKLKRDIARGVRQADEENPFELFIGATDIRYTYYKETDKILGQTFGMCVLQDFNAITPNILARTIETVEGGGIIVLLIKTLDSLKQLYSMSMDIHSRYRTEAHNDVVGRFNERFMLSLSTCKNCLVVDDELNILPISSHVRNITQFNYEETDKPLIIENDHVLSEKEVELKELKASLRETQPVGALVELARTLDQAKGILTFAEAISEKSLKSTVALLAARGRGKSAALGLSIACAIAYGYSNIFVTAPSPENLKTLFEMVVVGFNGLGFKEHMDYEIIQSTNPALNHAVVRINVFRNHRQVIQYIAPHESQKLSQAELLVIDEAAAIPLPLVQKLIGPYLVFISSTVNGYEGTGRSLSLKLIKQLRNLSSLAHHSALSANNKNSKEVNQSTSLTNTPANLQGRTLREVSLEEPIRYAEGDYVEKWLNDLLCLDCANKTPKLTRSVGGSGVPHPSLCELYYVDRDTLFSYHKASEAFLQKMMALYVSSHYKNSPNDLQLMADAPAHNLFVLLGPVTEQTSIPDILCVIQVCLEGEISSSTYMKQSVRGINPSGDLIPWCISQQFQNSEFAGLSGARVVRIAVHPELQSMGYGSRAMELLIDYYENKFTSIDENDDDDKYTSSTYLSDAAKEILVKEDVEVTGDSKLLVEAVAPRKHLPPLLSQLSDRPPETLHWMGVSFGLTPELFKFWYRRQFKPLYVRQSVNEITGEHTCVMVRAQDNPAATLLAAQKGIIHSGMFDDKSSWLQSFATDFRRRFSQLLAYEFRKMPINLATCVLSDTIDHNTEGAVDSTSIIPLTNEELSFNFTSYDMKRIESYSRNLVDYHIILDLLPVLARLYFTGKLAVNLSYVQASIIVALGLQMKSLSEAEKELNIGSTQLLAMFNKCVRKLSNYLRSVEESAITDSIIRKGGNVQLNPDLSHSDSSIGASIEQELKDSSKTVKEQLTKKTSSLLKSLKLEKYEIDGTEEDWAESEKQFSQKNLTSVSLKSTKPKHQEPELNKTKRNNSKEGQFKNKKFKPQKSH